MAEPSRPGEGIEWKIGQEVLLERIANSQVGPEVWKARLVKVGRIWVEVEHEGFGNSWLPFRGRFDRSTGLMENIQPRFNNYCLWKDQEARERYPQRLQMEGKVTSWAQHFYPSSLKVWSTEKLERLEAFLIEIGELT